MKVKGNQFQAATCKSQVKRVKGQVASGFAKHLDDMPDVWKIRVGAELASALTTIIVIQVVPTGVTGYLALGSGTQGYPVPKRSPKSMASVRGIQFPHQL